MDGLASCLLCPLKIPLPPFSLRAFVPNIIHDWLRGLQLDSARDPMASS